MLHILSRNVFRKFKTRQVNIFIVDGPFFFALMDDKIVFLKASACHFQIQSGICFHRHSHLLHTSSCRDINLTCARHLSHMSLKVISPTQLTQPQLCEQVWLDSCKDTLLSADGNNMGGSLALALGAAGLCVYTNTLPFSFSGHCLFRCAFGEKLSQN